MANPTNQILGDFSIKDIASSVDNVAHLSLGISLDAYASTFKSMGNTDTGTEKEAHTASYISNLYIAITFFHHYAEISFKEILRESDIAIGDKYGFNKVLKAIKDNINDLPKYAFISTYSSELEGINKLRNEMYHEGDAILNCANLDNLFGKTILPFVSDMMNISGVNRDAFFKQTQDGVNPYCEIINHFNIGLYDYRVVGVLKEVARALSNKKINRILLPHNTIDSLGNIVVEHIDIFKSINDDKVATLEEIAELKELRNGGSVDIKECPVCGTKTLLRSWDWYGDEDDDGNIIGNSGYYVYEIKCENCTLELDNKSWGIKSGNLDLTKYFKVRTQL